MSGSSLDKNLSDLLKSCESKNGIASNSKDVKPGYIFCALSEKANEYIDQAIANGASVIISNRNYTSDNVLHITHKSPIDIYHKICSNFYNKQPKHISAVTGTNGKTSVCYFFQQICDLASKKSASIGTIGLVVENKIIEVGSLTSPDAAKLHKFLYDLACNSVDYVALEASSHGLDQKRMHSVNVESAVFTNLTQDHLDYHGDMESYFKCKLRLFTEILSKNAILNSDDKYSARIAESIASEVITYGVNNADIQILEQTPNCNGQVIKFKIFDRILEVELQILGKFQAYNLAAAIGLALVNGIDVHQIDCKQIKSPPGRMEYIKNNRALKVFVDYAHTPDGLQNALLSIRWHFPGRKITSVFGCGGDRDQGKRSIMGRIAFDLADKIIICDDNPRTEDPAKIRHEVLAECKTRAIEIGDRANAIEYAILNAKQDEIIIISGKGHETIQKFANHEIQLNDVDIINRI